MQSGILLVKNIIASNSGRLSSPYKLTYAITYQCDLRCKICNIWAKPYQQELSVDEIDKIFRKLRNLSWLDLTGGELTLRKDLLDVVQVIKLGARNLRIFHCTTNGQSPERAYELAQKLIAMGVTPIINVNLEGPREINDQLKRIEGSYQKSLDTMSLLKRLKKGHYFFSCTISNLNIDHLDQFLRDLKSDLPNFSYADVHFNLFHNSDHFYKNPKIRGRSNLNVEQVKKYMDLVRKGSFVKRMLGKSFINQLSKYFETHASPITCQALHGTCFINPYGEVYSCIIYDRIVGKLREVDYDLGRIWNTEGTLQARKDILKNKCPGCWTPCEAYPAILGNLGKISIF